MEDIERYKDVQAYTRGDNITIALEYANDNGYYMEFGVYRGASINSIAESEKYKVIYGFDSFKGLPEPWILSESNTYKVGHFTTGIPKVRSNVMLYSGFFNETLPSWINDHDGEVAFLHIDSDLYSSCKEILTYLNDKIINGTVIVFDELCDWNGSGKYQLWEDGEWKALNEWLDEFDRSVDPISRGREYQSSVIVTK